MIVNTPDRRGCNVSGAISRKQMTGQSAMLSIAGQSAQLQTIVDVVCVEAAETFFIRLGDGTGLLKLGQGGLYLQGQAP